jgi:hypothetical protein
MMYPLSWDMKDIIDITITGIHNHHHHKLVSVGDRQVNDDSKNGDCTSKRFILDIRNKHIQDIRLLLHRLLNILNILDILIRWRHRLLLLRSSFLLHRLQASCLWLNRFLDIRKEFRDIHPYQVIQILNTIIVDGKRVLLKGTIQS